MMGPHDGQICKTWEVHCRVCEHPFLGLRGEKPDAIAELRREGWATRGGRWICSACAVIHPPDKPLPSARTAPGLRASRAAKGRYMMNTKTVEGLKEAVARIVDPEAFKTIEEHANEALAYLDGSSLDYRSQRIGRREYDKREPERETALSKAEAILSLISSSPLSTGLDEEGWRPIETAPRDGTWIDVWGPDYGRFANVRWGKPAHECGEMGAYCDSDWHRLKPGWVDGTFNEIFGRTRPGFTHWLPLPAAPATVLSGGDMASVASRGDTAQGPKSDSALALDDGQPDEQQEWADYDRDC